MNLHLAASVASEKGQARSRLRERIYSPGFPPRLSSPACAPLTTPEPPSRRRDTGIDPTPLTLEQLCFGGAVIQTAIQAGSQT